MPLRVRSKPSVTNRLRTFSTVCPRHPMVRRVAVSLLRRAPGKKRATTPTKRKKAGWDDALLLVLQGISA